MKIDNVEVCEPIEYLLNKLEEGSFTIVEKYVNDYHFNELYIKIKFSEVHTCYLSHSELQLIDNKYIFKCHWSTVEVV